MLAAIDKKLRWWGIDMRPRWLRRAAVVGTYIVFIPLIASLGIDRWAGHPYLAFFAMITLTSVWKAMSVFRPNGVLKSFEDRPVAAGNRKWMMVNGLDEWARYRFGAASFDEATEEQKADLLTRYRVGTFAVPAKCAAPGPRLDERERRERDGAARWALGQIAFYLPIAAGMLVGDIARHRAVEPMEIASEFWTFSLLAQTLPQARVLWTEPDPRETSGEIEMVQEPKD